MVMLLEVGMLLRHKVSATFQTVRRHTHRQSVCYNDTVQLQAIAVIEELVWVVNSERSLMHNLCCWKKAIEKDSVYDNYWITAHDWSRYD